MRHQYPNDIRMAQITPTFISSALGGRKRGGSYSRHSGADSRHLGRSQGFTLIEAIVSVSVFALAMTSIVGVYLAVSRLNQEGAALQALQQNSRFIFEDLSKTIRNGQIDYASFGGSIPQPYATNLYLIDQDGVGIRIYQQGYNLVISKSGVGQTNLSSSEIRILDFKVFIWPQTNPFPKGPLSPKEQPTVTIYLDLEARLNARDIVRFPFETTVATKQYLQ